MICCLLDILKESIIFNTQQKIKIKEKEKYFLNSTKKKINYTLLKLKIPAYQKIPLICEKWSHGAEDL